MQIKLKCPKCGENLELIVEDNKLQNFLNATKERNDLVIIPTWRCGLDCPYCQYHQQPDMESIMYTDKLYKVDKELTSDEWIKLLNSFAPATHTFTGGEPLRYKEIAKVLNSLPNWSITSNTMHLTLHDIDLTKCTCWTASFHPHINTEAQMVFFDNIHYIKKQGVNIGVTLVAQISTIKQVLDWADFIHRDGFEVHIHPYYDDETFSWYEHPEESKLLLASPYLVYGEGLFEYKGRIGSGVCRGGRHYFAIGPDGKVFRCLTDLLHGRHETKFMGFPEKCDLLCVNECFYPCDWNYGGRK